MFYQVIDGRIYWLCENQQEHNDGKKKEVKQND
jgi:hypothetical protein